MDRYDVKEFNPGLTKSPTGEWVKWEDIRALLGDGWILCDRCGSLEVVQNMVKVVLANDLLAPNWGLTNGKLPEIDGGESFNTTLLLCPKCKRSWVFATREWFEQGGDR